MLHPCHSPLSLSVHLLFIFLSSPHYFALESLPHVSSSFFVWCISIKFSLLFFIHCYFHIPLLAFFIILLYNKYTFVYLSITLNCISSPSFSSFCSLHSSFCSSSSYIFCNIPLHTLFIISKYPFVYLSIPLKLDQFYINPLLLLYTYRPVWTACVLNTHIEPDLCEHIRLGKVRHMIINNRI